MSSSDFMKLDDATEAEVAVYRAMASEWLSQQNFYTDCKSTARTAVMEYIAFTDGKNIRGYQAQKQVDPKANT